MGVLAAVGLQELHLPLGHYELARGIDRGTEAATAHSQTVASSSSHTPLAAVGGHVLAPAAHHDPHEVIEHIFNMADGGQTNGIGSDHGREAVLTELLQGTSSAAHGASSSNVADIAAQVVIMPSAEQLAAAAAEAPQALVADNQQHNEIVGKVLADALHGGGGPAPDIEGLVHAIGAHGRAGNQALEALASHGMEAVPNGHMASFAGFAGGHGCLMMDPMIVHQDAAPAHG
jgi:hypothetical protein